MANSDYMEFGFGAGDEAVNSGKFPRFKAKEGETYHVSFVWWEKENGKPNLDSKTPRFIGVKRHFVQGVGFFVSKGPEYDRLAGGPPKMQIATVIAIWPTNRKGDFDKTRFLAGDFEVKPWVFGQDKYEQLKRRHEEFPFGTHDLLISCTDSQYQKMDLSPRKDNLFRRCLGNESLTHLANQILTATDAIVGMNDLGEPIGLRDSIARDLSLDKIREKLGMPTGGISASSTENTSQVDAILDDLIDS